MGASYPYATGNKIEERYKYEYTPYAGKALLDSYLLSRTAAIESLRARLAKMKAADDVASALQNLRSLHADKKEGCFCSIGFFAGILRRLYDNHKEQNDVPHIFAFIKKFEVFKRLFLHYDNSTLRKSSSDYRCLLVYILFANVLAAYISTEGEIGKRTIAFNALLKLNDAIASVLDKVSTSEETALAIRSFETELEIFGSYAGGIFT